MYMGELQLYKELKDADEDKRLQLLAHAIEEAKKGPDLSQLATKQDLATNILGLEVRLMKAMNDQTWKFIGGVALLGVIFKLAEMFLK